MGEKRIISVASANSRPPPSCDESENVEGEKKEDKWTDREPTNSSYDRFLDFGDQRPILEEVVPICIREGFIFHLLDISASYGDTNIQPPQN